MRLLVVSILISTLMGHPLFGQTKFEQEQRVRSSAIPDKARSFIDQCAVDKKIKWYQERSNQGTSFEAKFKWQGFRYSIEFDDDGNLQDVEQTVSFNSLPKEIQNAINQQLTNQFSRHKIQKTQIQQTGATESLLAFMQGKEAKTTVAYELVLKGHQNRQSHYYEVLADAKGKIIKQLQIESRPADNLDF